MIRLAITLFVTRILDVTIRVFVVGDVVSLVIVPHAVDEVVVTKAETRFIDESDVSRFEAWFDLVTSVSILGSRSSVIPSQGIVAYGASRYGATPCRTSTDFCCAHVERDHTYGMCTPTPHEH